MGVVTVEIAGIERSTMIGKNIAWTDSVNGQAQARFTLADDADGFVPADGQAVEIKQDGTIRFDGMITGRPRRLAGPAHASQLTFYQVTVGSYELLLNKKTVTRTYTGVAFETIVADLDATYLSADGITLNVTAGTSHSITFNGETVAEALDILCELEADGRTWRMDIGKILTIEVLAATAAPVVLDVATGTLGLDPRPTITPDRNAYANTVIITGGSPDFQITFTAFDAAEITARIAAEGGDGIYEYTEERSELKTEGEVQAAAEGVLEKRKTLRERFVGATRVAGFAAGQSVTVDVDEMDISSQVFFAESVRTVTNAAGTEFIHTINGITGDPDGGWQSYYRREKKKPRTIPMQIEATPGLVRVAAAKGVLIHDPFRDPVLFAQGTPSGVQDESVSVIGITPDATQMISIRRDGATSETVCETWAIVANKPATSTTNEFRWAELAATAFKTEILISPNGTRGAYVQLGAPGALGIIDLVNGLLLGSVSTGISNNANPGEPVWSPDGSYIYWPDIAAANVYVYDVSDPTAPTEDNVFGLATLTTASGLWISADGNSLVVTGAGGVAGVDVTDPTAPSQDTTVVGAADYISLDEDNGILVGMVRANGTQCRVITLNITGSSVTLNAEQLVGVVTSVMVGSHVIHSDGAAMCFSHRISLGSPNLLDAHVFNTVAPAAVTFTQTFDYTHGAAGNVGPVKTKRGLAVLWVFGNGTNAQVTFGTEQLDQIDPYEVETPVRTPFGGTGNVGPYQKGVILVGDGLETPPLSPMVKLAGPLDDQVLTGDESAPTGVLWGHELSRNYHFGAFKEAFNALVTSDGATVTMSLEKAGGGDLTLIFTDGNTLLDCTPALTIALTAGSDTVPTFNYVYILQSDKILTVSTVDWPATEHNKVGVFFVPSAAKVQSDGVFVNQNINDFLNGGTESMGHGLHIAEAIRHMGARWNSGVDGNGTTGYLTIVTNVGTPDNVFFKSTAGVVYQLHEHTIDAVDTSGAGRLLVVNDSVAAYDEITDVADLLLDSTGASMAGKYFNLHFWGVANKTGEFAPMMVNLPSGSYNKQSDAEQDVSGFDDSSIPAAFDRESTTGFLIVRVTLRHQAASGGTWTHVSAVDIRRTAPGAVGGGSGVVTTEFADNALKIFDEADVTKVMAFDVGGIATGTERTVAAEDGPMTIPLTSELDDLTDAGDTVLHKHDIYILADGSRAFSGDVDFGGNLVDNAPFLRGFIDGFITENDTDTDHDIKFNPGVCTDSLVSNDKVIELSSAIVKRIDAAWAAGTTNGGMATGSVAADTEYNLIVIEKDSDGTIDAMFDVSATGANVPAGYTARRRVGSVFTDGSANIRVYTQSGDFFGYEAAVGSVDDTTITLDVFETGTLPAAPSTLVLLSLEGRGTGNTVGVQLRQSGSSVVPGAMVQTADFEGSQFRIITANSSIRCDSSSQFEYSLIGTATSSERVIIKTLGWFDPRGQNE